MADWDFRFMTLAQHIAQWSKDRSSKVGAVVVGPGNEIRAVGYNGFPRRVDDEIEYRQERPEKYFWVEHAERNAIYSAARVGTPLEGCKIYLNWFPCMDCARAIVQSGMIRLICAKPDTLDEKWGEEFKKALLLFEEAGVVVQWWPTP